MKSQASKIMSFSKDLTFSRYNLFSSFTIGNIVALHLPWRLPRRKKKKSPLGNTIKFPIASKRQGGGAVGNLQSEILLLLLQQAEFTKDM